MSATNTERSIPSTPRRPSPQPGNPWKGLHYYTEQDRGIFFGRDQETEDLLRLVRRDTLSVLFARSGLGKTSLLRAGVIPRLHDEEGFLPVIVRVDYAAAALPPTRQIIDAIRAAAAAAGVEVENSGESGSTAILEGEQETLWEFFHRHQFWGPRNDLVVPVLILDQFEEGFTLGRHSPHTAEFHAQLADLVENRMPRHVQRRLEATDERPAFDTRAQHYRVILSLREDFVPKLDALQPIMPAVMRNRFALAPLDREYGVEVICRAGGQWVSEAVAWEIVAVVAGESQTPEQQAQVYAPGVEIEPAYLSVMCHELFRRMTELGSTEIGSDLVAAEHGNILEALYERSFEGLDPKTRLFIEDRLLTASGFRGTVPVAEARREDVPMADLEMLVNRRLLRFEDRLGTTHLELSHDLLTRIVQQSRDKRRAEAEREAERQRAEEFRAKLRRTHLQALAGVVGVLLLLGAILFYSFGWLIPYQSYCRDYTNRWGMIEPVGPLPSSVVAHRSSTFRLTRQGWFGKVQTMEAIDANYQLTAQHGITTYLEDPRAPQAPREKASRYEFVYDRAGRVVSEVAWDRFNRMVSGLVYVPQAAPAVSLPGAPHGLLHWLKTYLGGVGGARDRSDSAKATFFGPDGYPQPPVHSRAEFVEIHYDPSRGFEVMRLYSDREGRPMPGPDDAYGQHRAYDEQGRLIRLTSLNADSKPMIDAAGNASLEIQYDQDGNVIEQRAFDANGEPTLLRGGYYRVRSQHDEWGRETERKLLNLRAEPVVDTHETGAHRITWQYDDRGNVTGLKVYNQDDEPMVAKGCCFDFPAHEQRATFDPQNRPETVAYFDQEGKPSTGPGGWHSYRSEYDNRGFISALDFLDGEGHPVDEETTGAHRWERVNDAFGQPIEERFVDTERNPIATRDGGYHLRKNEYDSAGNLVVQTYFDMNNAPVADRTHGAPRFVQRFDRFRHAFLKQYFDEAGQPIKNTQGFHRVESTYDDYGSERDTRWYDKDGHPGNGPDGVHRVSYESDGRGLHTRKAYYDAENRPATHKGIYETLFGYNDKRQQTKRQLFGLNRQPVEDAEGNHHVLIEYDERGRQTKYTRLRADGSPNQDRELGIATKRHSFDRENREIEQAYYNAEDHLVTGPEGFARRSVVYHIDARVDYHQFSPNGQLAFNPLVGYAIKKMDPRTRGNTTESYHGPDGALITGPEGYAEVRRRWDNDGTLLSEAYFGPDGAPITGPDGHHRMEHTPGAISEASKYFDVQEREILSSGPATLVSIIYIGEVRDIRQPGAKAGLHAGDILWQYGNWSFPKAWNAEWAKGTQPDAISRAVAEAFFTERGRLSTKPVSMTVIRNDTPLTVTMPPLSENNLGVRLTARAVPVTTFKEWLDTPDLRPR